ncbi:MAG: hypothetical protein KF893_16670 [Caldilineaceae bacterium]|nr:hypothetical protein [Caldilineaceae bacterium]
MSKSTKSTRPRRPSVGSANPRSYSEILKREQQNSPVAVVATPAPAVTKSAPTREERREEKIDWTNEYSQVVSDLRQLGIISGILFALMIGLGFLI